MKRRDAKVETSVRRAKKSAQQKRMAQTDGSEKDAMNAGEYMGGDQEEWRNLERSTGRKKRIAAVVETEGGDEADGGKADTEPARDRAKKAKGDAPAGPRGFTEFNPDRIGLRKKKNAPRAGEFNSKSKFKRR
eukprot:FR735833.1.p2 GENE.FR735833.1~~FR735833.1.p2  ORF type:complete len:133 (+),score=16.59 FR735833.1:405-803(+)